MATTLSDVHRHIIQTHILPRLDGPSLSTTATASSYLQTLCSDDTLWSQISKSTWPSITHPLLDDIISTFPAGHRSFFQDSFPSLIAGDLNHPNHHRSTWATSKLNYSSFNLDTSSHPSLSQLISAVDIRYQNDVVYSTVHITDTTSDFLISSSRIELNNDPTTNIPGSKQVPKTSQTIDLIVDEIAGADKATLKHLKESLQLNWILIDPTRKRSGNLSSIKPVSARQDWVTNETRLRYVTVLPGCHMDEIVQCKILVVLGVGEGGVGLHVKHVTLQLKDLDSNSVNGRDFLVITQGAIIGEKNVRRKVVSDEQRSRGFQELKEIKRERKEWVKKKKQKQELNSYGGILMCFLISVYIATLLL